MSRFNNPKALAIPAQSQPFPAAPVSATALGVPAVAPPAPRVVRFPEAQPSLMQLLGFAMLCVFLLSGYANDFSYMLMHGKAYISTVCVILVPAILLFSGSIQRGLQSPIGKYWLAFVIWLIVAAPFSVWKGNTAVLLFNYVPKSYLMLFYVTAFALTLRQCRRLMYVLIFGAVLVVIACMKFGSGMGGRLSIPTSIFFANANELGLQLALGVAFTTFVFFTKSRALKVLGLGLIAVSLYYTLKTASRGVFLATAIMFFAVFLISKHKALVLAVGLPVLLIGLAIMPANVRHRLLFIKTDTSAAQASDLIELSALESQMQRQRLLKMSLELTFTHPLVGVGPGQFAVAAAGEKEKEGERAEWRGTHNTYTQVSSEAGLPAFFFYCAALFLCLRANLRTYRRAARKKGLEEVAGLSFSLFLAALVYAIATFFFHIAYSYYLPLILGMSIAVHLAARPALERHGQI
jgi:O-antigen ligase